MLSRISFLIFICPIQVQITHSFAAFIITCKYQK